MDFRTRRQVAVLAVVGVVAAGVLWLALLAFLPEASCSDGRRNQGEEQADCGGPCLSCAFRERRDIKIFWARHVRVRENTYDVAAEVKNPNVKLGAASFEYEFKLFDAAGVAVASRRGRSFLYPSETAHLAEIGLVSGRVIRNTTITIHDPVWVLADTVGPDVIAGGKEFALEAAEDGRRSAVRAVISNRTIGDVPNVTVAALAFDADGNLLGAHRTIIPALPAGSSQPVKFIWPAAFSAPVSAITVEARSDVLLSALRQP